MIRTEPLGIEVRFLVPLYEDREVGDGRSHPPERWRWLNRLLRKSFGGYTLASGTFLGSWMDPATRRAVEDESRQYTIALKPESVPRLRVLLAEQVAPAFAQKCIYLVAGADAELVWNAIL